jgi:hypothetical protein
MWILELRLSKANDLIGHEDSTLHVIFGSNQEILDLSQELAPLPENQLGTKGCRSISDANNGINIH